MFWSQPGAILKSKNLETGEETTIFETDVFDDGNNNISNITLDVNNQKIYFHLHINNPQPQRDLLMVVDYSGANLIEIEDFFTPTSMVYHHGENRVYYTVSNGTTDQIGIRYFDLLTENDGLVYNSTNCSSLRLDENDSVLYFSEGLDGWKKINLDGTGLQNLSFLPATSTIPPIGTDLSLDVINNDFYISKSPILSGSKLILRFNESGMQIDTLVQIEFSGFSTSSIPDAPFVDNENEKMYYFFLEDDIFSDEVTRVFKRANLDGTNLETLDSTFYLNTNNSEEITAWTIDPSVEPSSLEVSVTHYYSDERKLNHSPPNQTVPFKICADGAEGSIFGINFSDSVELSNIILRIAEDPNGNDIDKYGSFTNLSPISDDISISYQHPKYVGDYSTAH